MKKKILISKEPWETRAAITRDGRLQNVYFSQTASQGLERSYFKGKVTKVLPGIQTAFVDIGQERAGFLHISEIDRDLAFSAIADNIQVDEEDKVATKPPPKDISKILKEGDSILVQVSKEPIYEKGAKLTTCFTLPGRFIVLMPNIPRFGVSKRIESKEERVRLRELIKSSVPEGMGAIIRTSAESASKQEIAKDIAYLVKSWRTIQKNYEKAEGIEKIHEDLPIELRVVRDNLDADVEAVVIDDKKTQEQVHKFVRGIAPEYSQAIKLWKIKSNLFEYHEIDKQLQRALEKKVELKSGGSIIIERTEAMTVVDVNTGRYTGKKDLEETILKTNLEAAEEIVRQLRLRNIGGLIVIDFIDMGSQSNQKKLTSALEKSLKEQDRFQSVVLKVSEFGLVQMTRKRSGKTLMQQLMEACSNCKGLGVIKSTQSLCAEILRKFQRELKNKPDDKHKVSLEVNPRIFELITTVEFNAILDLEKLFNCSITILSKKEIAPDSYKVEFS